MRCHMIFDVKFGENFRRKARLVAGGHMTDTPNTLTYSSVVSHDSVHIVLKIVALNELSVMASSAGKRSGHELAQNLAPKVVRL